MKCVTTQYPEIRGDFIYLTENEQAMCCLFLGRQPLTEKELKAMSPIALAYIGDTVFDMYLRTRLVAFTELTPAGLHRAASRFANASAQAQIMYRIESELTEEEHEVFRHGRNAKSHTIPKNAKPYDYRMATAFECVLGHLYLSGNDQRLYQLLDLAVPNLREEASM